jgi:Glycosyltransferase 61
MTERSPSPGPATFYESVTDWLASCAGAATAAELTTTIYDVETITFIKPKGLEPDSDIFHWFLTRTLVSPAASVTRVPGGYLCGDGVHSAVLASDGALIWNASRGHEKTVENHWMFTTDLPPAIPASTTIAPLMTRPGWANSYYHWMFDVLPRVHLLQESGFTIDQYAMHDRGAHFQYETLTATGIRDYEVRELTSLFHIQARELVLPSIVLLIAPRWVCTFLRDQFLPKGEAGRVTQKRRRLYISRATATRGRKVVNEQQVLDTLSKLNFLPIVLESMSVREQARLFSQAEFVVGPHGGGLTNLVFCSPGTQVVEFFAPRYVHPSYWMVSNRCGLDYYYLIGEGQRAPTWAAWPTRESGLDPIAIDVNQLTDLLMMAGI